MAISLRISDVLKDEAVEYAAGIGISVNALVSIALRDYLDKRPRRTASPAAVPVILRTNRQERRAAARKPKVKGR